MIIIVSPSKTLDFSSKIKDCYTDPFFLKEAFNLITILRELTISEISKLMSISEKLAILNYHRYLDFNIPFTTANTKQAIYAFKGDVYDGLTIENFSQEDIHYAQSHLRIISGLYGLLRPLDLIQPYRLEMGIKLTYQNSRNLYEYWENKITIKLKGLLQNTGNNILVNLTSLEYFKVINRDLLQGTIVTPVFKERKSGGNQIVALFAKRARGMMAAYIIKNRIKSIEDIKQFNEGGYLFDDATSSEDEIVFTR